MIEVRLTLQPEGEQKEVDGLLWGGAEPTMFDFDIEKPDELKHESGVVLMHQFRGFLPPKSKPAEITMLTSYPYRDEERLCNERIDILAATIACLPNQQWLSDGEPTPQMVKAACYMVRYENDEMRYLTGLEFIERKQPPSADGEKAETQEASLKRTTGRRLVSRAGAMMIFGLSDWQFRKGVENSLIEPVQLPTRKRALYDVDAMILAEYETPMNDSEIENIRIGNHRKQKK